MKALKISFLLILIGAVLFYVFSLKDDSNTNNKPPKNLPEKHTEKPLKEEKPERPDINIETKNNDIEFEVIETSTSEYNGVEISRHDLWIKNPSTQSMWDVSIFEPEINDDNLPAAILIPGGVSDKSNFIENVSPKKDYSAVELFASEGFVTVAFSAEGRGDSEGEQDYNGHIDQDGLYEIYRYLESKDNVDEENIGIVSFSYGVAMASGMLGRYEVPLKYYIEWEGPVDREYVSVGCSGRGAVKDGATCEDEEYWSEREAINFVENFKIDHFIVLQTEDDHVQETHNHSLDSYNLALEHLDWARVNGSENKINQSYSYDEFPLLDNRTDINELAITCIKELIKY